MVIVKTFFNEVLLIKPNIFNDFRGSFRENYRKKTFFTKARRKINFCQDNLTYSKKGTKGEGLPNQSINLKSQNKGGSTS